MVASRVVKPWRRRGSTSAAKHLPRNREGDEAQPRRQSIRQENREGDEAWRQSIRQGHQYDNSGKVSVRELGPHALSNKASAMGGPPRDSKASVQELHPGRHILSSKASAKGGRPTRHRRQSIRPRREIAAKHPLPSAVTPTNY
jgi:hypothetical protein